MLASDPIVEKVTIGEKNFPHQEMKENSHTQQTIRKSRNEQESLNKIEVAVGIIVVVYH